MQEILCPHCGKAFTIDEAGYAAIVQQVRDREFTRELERQTEAAVKLSAAEKDAAIATLRSKLEAAEVQKTLAVHEESEKQLEEIRALREKLSAAESEKTLAVQAAEHKAEQARFEKDKELMELHAALEKQEAEFRLQKQQSDTEQALILKQKDEEIAFYKDMKVRMSTTPARRSENRRAVMRMSAIFTNSDGCKLNGPICNHRCAPKAVRPNTAVSSNNTTATPQMIHRAGPAHT